MSCERSWSKAGQKAGLTLDDIGMLEGLPRLAAQAELRAAEEDVAAAAMHAAEGGGEPAGQGKAAEPAGAATGGGMVVDQEAGAEFTTPRVVA